MKDKYVVSRAVRQERKRAARGVRSGRYPLVVVGNQKAGYRLGAELPGKIVLFGPDYNRQRDALVHGQEHYAPVARKVSLKAAA